jgi:cystathionine beta-lyase/cystathionine gamma-synthase
MNTKLSRETQLIHTGERHVEGAVTTPIFQSSTFIRTSDDAGGYHDIRYGRISNTPNHIALHEKLAAIESGEAALVTSSGMAAIATSLIAIAAGGGHVLAQKVLYGGTNDFLLHDAPSLGITFDYIEDDPDDWKRKLRPNTKAIYVEALTNPLLDVIDHREVARFANEHGIVAMIDNTFTSPINFRPIEIGFDLSLHSATKYLNGHNDLIAGAAIGSAKLIDAIRHKLNHLGGSLDAHACFLLQRSLKTLAVRVRQQNANAFTLARFLDAHDAVGRVRYPGLPCHPQHVRATELFDGFGGMMSFELRDGVEATLAFLSRLEIPLAAPSLGGVETLISRPAALSHVGLSAEQRASLGISDSLVRLSVGLESSSDLIDDFAQALG